MPSTRARVAPIDRRSEADARRSDAVASALMTASGRRPSASRDSAAVRTASSGASEHLPGEVGHDRPLQVESAASSSRNDHAGEQVEVSRERAVRQVIDHFEPGAARHRQEMRAIEEHSVLRRLQPRPAIAEPARTSGCRAAAPRRPACRRAAARAAPSAGCAADRSRAPGSATSSPGRTARRQQRLVEQALGGTRRRRATGATTGP